MNHQKKLSFFFSLCLLSACSQHEKLSTVPHVDINKFMGDWYVIAAIPTLFEKGAHNAVESYRLNDNGSIATHFSYNKDALNGPLKVMTPTGYVKADTGNAVWGMQFIWPIKADYRIIYLEENNKGNYTHTIIGRNARDYVWIMSRSPQVDAAVYQNLVGIVKQAGYNVNELKRIPHKGAVQ